MRIFVAGATGGVGKQVVQQALAAGHEVTAFVRTPAKLGLAHPALKVAQGDVRDPASIAAALPGHHAIVSVIGSNDRKEKTLRSEGTKNLVEAAKKAGVGRFVAISSVGVGDSREQAKRSSFVFGRIIMPLFLGEIFADHARAEDAIRQSGLDWTIVRPTGLSDAPGTKDVKVVLDGGKVGASISRADVAHFMVGCLGSSAYSRQAPSIYA